VPPGADNDRESEVTLATADECQKALETLTARISEMKPEDRAAHLADRTLSCRVTDLGITFLTRLGPDGADPVRQATGTDKPAQIRFIAKSDDVLAISKDPGSLARAWLAGRLKVEGNLLDLLRLRSLIS
jgi:SCP-2 sterol transfer family